MSSKNTLHVKYCNLLSTFYSPLSLVYSLWPKASGGGGNRTRVPRYFHAGFYVCSRRFGSRHRERLSTRLSQQPAGAFLVSNVPDTVADDPKLRLTFGRLRRAPAVRVA